MSSAHPESAPGTQELIATIEEASNAAADQSSLESNGTLELEQNNTDQDNNDDDADIPKLESDHNQTSTTETASSREHAHRRDGIPGIALVLAGGVVAAGAYLLKKKFYSSEKSSKKSDEAAIDQLFLEKFRHDTPSVPGAAAGGGAATPTLTEKRLVVSDRIDIRNIKTRFGSSEWQSSRKACTLSAPIVDQLVHAGAVVNGTVPTWPLGVDPSFSSSEIPARNHPSRTAREIAGIANPGAPNGHTHGGGEYGPAVAIAGGAADLCIAVDEVGSALIPAACCGVYAYRPTSGVLQLTGAALASNTLSTTCLLASDPNLLIRAAQALQVPGGGNDTAGIVSKYLVAEDLFALCDDEVKNAAPAVVAAVKRWAGPEHAQGLSLCDWLYHRIPSLTKFMPNTDTNDNNNNNNNTSSPRRTADVLSALTAAADAIRKWEWLRSSPGRWVSNKHRNATSAVSSIASGLSDNEYRAVELPQEIIAYLLEAEKISEKLYSNAITVADELAQGMRGALQEGYVFVVPTIPGPAPKMSGKDWEKRNKEFRNLSEQFAALASLAGVPQIVMPMPSPKSEKKAPLSISMVTLQRRDLVLVKAAAKLGPMLKEEAEKTAEGKKSGALSNSKKATSNGGSSSFPPGSGGGGTSSSSKKKGSNSTGNKGVSEENARAAESAKEDGNTAFKGGRYNEAVKKYSEAIQYNPHTAVYFSNRAMAYLKLGRYTAAEADCDAALDLDPSMVKALLRRGSAQLAQGRLSEARKDFERVLYLEPRNKQATEELERLKDYEDMPDLV